MAKSGEDEKAGATQQSAKQLSQSARRLRRSTPEAGSGRWRFSDNVDGSFESNIRFGYVVFLLGYQVLCSTAALAGYAQHLAGAHRRWK
jgi:hypothetical protein